MVRKGTKPAAAAPKQAVSAKHLGKGQSSKPTAKSEPPKKIVQAPAKKAMPVKKGQPAKASEDSDDEEDSEEFDENDGSGMGDEEDLDSDDGEDDDDDEEGDDDEEVDDEEDESDDEPNPKHPNAMRTMDEFLGGSGSEEDEEELPFEREAREHEESEAAVSAEAAADFRAEVENQPKFTLPGRKERRAALQPKEARSKADTIEGEDDEGASDEEGEDGEEEEEAGELVPPAVLKERIGAVVEVLSDFKNRREAGRPRADYMAQLARYKLLPPMTK